jgi:hypothetical protein
VRASFDMFARENLHVIRNNQGGTPDSNRRLALNAFVRGFEEAKVYQETGNEASAVYLFSHYMSFFYMCM